MSFNKAKEAHEKLMSERKEVPLNSKYQEGLSNFSNLIFVSELSEYAREKMRIKLSDAVVKLENVISRKRDGLNEQVIDDEILGYISIYKNGSEIYRNLAKRVLIRILVDSGMVRRKSDIIVDDWSDEE